jgi:membrane-associated protease RseP (regulator of RpoE activity)
MRRQRSIVAILACAALAPLAAALAPRALEAQVTTYRIAQRGVLGVMTQAVQVQGQPSRQRVVVDVVPESPAARAGIMKGDTIVRINGLAASDQVMGAPFEPGDTVVLRIRRDGRERDVTVVAAERSQQFEQFTIQALPDSIMRRVAVQMEMVRSQLDSVRRLPALTIEHAQGDSVIVLRFGSDSTHYVRVRPGFRGTIELDSLRRHMLADTLRARAFQLDTVVMRRFMHPDSLGGRAFHMDSLSRSAMERARIMMDSLPPHFEGGGARFFFRGDSAAMRPMEIFATNMSLGMRAVAGAELSELNPGLAEYFGTATGVLVLNARDGTPAAQAGLQAGDVITRAGETGVESIADLRRAIAAAPPGSYVALNVLRKGQPVTLRLPIPGGRQR